MQILIAEDRNSLGQYVASQIAHVLRERLETQDAVNIALATGSSQFELLNRLVEAQDVDWGRVCGFQLSEYIGLSQTHSASLAGFLLSRFAKKVRIAKFHALDGNQPEEKLLSDANASLDKQRLDILVCGIGENGHLALNDPPADFEERGSFHIVELDKACRKQQVGEGWFDSISEVPKRAITMTIQQIMQADHIFCAVPDRRKASVLKAVIEMPVSVDVPASVLQNHPNCQIVLDAASSGALSSESIESALRIG